MKHTQTETASAPENAHETSWIICDTVTKTYKVWSRFMDGKQIYQVSENKPGPNDGGYYSPESARKVKGL